MRLIANQKSHEFSARGVRIPEYEARVKHVPLKVLDIDIETVAAGFDDPQWVPQKITCVAWSWIDSSIIETRVCTPLGLFGEPHRRRKMLEPLLKAIDAADMLTGHNIRRFDLPIINAECMRLGLAILPSKLIEDTMRVVRSTGFKRSQDNMSTLLRLQHKKVILNWQQWQDAYDHDRWAGIRSRAASDVLQHKEMREAMLKRGWLKKPIMWHSK